MSSNTKLGIDERMWVMADDEGKGGVQKIHDVSANIEHKIGAAVQKVIENQKKMEYKNC